MYGAELKSSVAFKSISLLNESMKILDEEDSLKGLAVLNTKKLNFFVFKIVSPFCLHEKAKCFKVISYCLLFLKVT